MLIISTLNHVAMLLLCGLLIATNVSSDLYKRITEFGKDDTSNLHDLYKTCRIVLVITA